MAHINEPDLVTNGWVPDPGRGWSFVPRGYSALTRLALASSGSGNGIRIDGLTYTVDNMNFGAVAGVSGGRFSDSFVTGVGDVVLRDAFKAAVATLNAAIHA